MKRKLRGKSIYKVNILNVQKFKYMNLTIIQVHFQNEITSIFITEFFPKYINAISVFPIFCKTREWKKYKITI